MGITSKSQMIDVAAIEQGCAQLVEVASQFTTHAATLKEFAADINTDALSVDKEGVYDNITTIAAEIEKFEGIVSGIASAIVMEARSLHSTEQRQLDEYLASLEEDN